MGAWLSRSCRGELAALGYGCSVNCLSLSQAAPGDLCLATNSAHAGSGRKSISPGASLGLPSETRGVLALPSSERREMISAEIFGAFGPRAQAVRVIHKPVALAWHQRPSSPFRARAAPTLPPGHLWISLTALLPTRTQRTAAMALFQNDPHPPPSLLSEKMGIPTERLSCSASPVKTRTIYLRSLPFAFL